MKQFFTVLITCLLVLSSARSLFAQRPAATPAATPAPTDSTRQIRSAADTIPETVRRNGIRVGTSTLTPEDGSASLDTARVTPAQEAKIRKIVPRKATIRSLILPGLGQIYNRQYWKLPFIYGGLVGAVYSFQWNQNLYNQYLTGYREAFFSNVNSQYNAKVAVVRERVLTVQQLKRATDQFQRQRDLTVILTAVGWALNAVEANVAAHMKTFDLSDDISMNVHPNILPLPGTGIIPGVRVAFTFK
ncbi:DUF5683 domain-containing protein [Spirosoma sp. KUDC1026]|uniref:DUF5683 domain-containing protein n=1 Tax=Spirosoma sp. KUDC1026 TaxID=2745947 RepID=UPI00159BBD43|nr:DUF5683 domain-containing protein [Spirosoma sp. KUDC1026]QKZ12601.1 hypothetical protein HU175_08135 [Spirosoma sp. KUDC1026]